MFFPGQLIKCVDDSLVANCIVKDGFYIFHCYSPYEKDNQRIMLLDNDQPPMGFMASRFVAATRKEIEKFFDARVADVNSYRYTALDIVSGNN